MNKSLYCLLSLALAAPLLAPVHAAPAARVVNHDLDAALGTAVAAGKADQVRDLLGRGADPNSKSADGAATPMLCVAALNPKSVDIVRLLVQSGASVESVTAQGDSALAVAALAGNLDTVNFLLKSGAQIEANADGGMTPLICASATGKTEVVRALLKAGANVNAETIEGGTALIYGSAKSDGGTGNLDTVKLLTGAGADISAATVGGQTAIEIARDSGLNEIGEYLEGIQKRDLGLLQAAISGDWKAIKAALAAGANPRFQTTIYQDADDHDGTVATAAMRLRGDSDGFDEATATQILAHSDLEVHGKDGDTALALAVLRRDLVMMRLLLKAGANPNVASADTGETPLMVAAEFGTLPTVQALIAAGARTDATSADGQTAKFFARHNKNKDVQQFFANQP